MASGFGVNGTPGRCYPIWLDFTKCLADAEFPKDCKDFRDDYLECLHHRKEANRQIAISKELRRQQEAAKAAEKEAAVAAKAAKKAGDAPPS